jgi:RNA polymerase sigma-70 factor (ECF subfamily)
VSTAASSSTIEPLAQLQRFFRLYYNDAPRPRGIRPRRRRTQARVDWAPAAAALPAEVAAGITGMPFDVSDRALVGRVREGDQTAFSTLHRRYYRKIYRFAYLRTNNPDDATDIASETFCRALQRLSSFEFRRSDSIYPWLHQIASNLVIDQARARPAGGMLSLDAQLADDLESFISNLPAEGPSAQDILEQKEIHAAVHEAIEQLPADQHRALVFRFFADLSIREIAREMDRSEGAIKSLLHRALQGIRDRLRSTAAASRGVVRHHQERATTHARETIQIRPGDAR